MSEPAQLGSHTSALVLGLGRFGGGAGAVRFLCEQGVRVGVSDLRTAAQLAPTLTGLADLGFATHLGGHPPEILDGVDLLVVNPAIPPWAPTLAEARRREIRCTSELELFLERCPAPVTAITGTNGKSTTTALAAHLLAAGETKVHVGGNLGTSLLPLIATVNAEDRVILEVSSFQADLLPPAPLLTTLVTTHVTADHLDRYGEAQAYHESKGRLLHCLTPAGNLVTNREDPVTAAWPTPPGRRRVTYGADAPAEGHLGVAEGALVSALGEHRERLMALADIPTPGNFQYQNCLAATAVALLAGLEPDLVTAALATFPGLEHRIQPLGEVRGVRLVDNGVSTAPETTLTALEALEGPIHLVAGGKSKGADLDDFAAALRGRTASLHLFGKVGPELAARVEGVWPAGSWTCSPALEEALDRALETATPGETLLFSPAFSSFDAFLNFKERAGVWRAWAAKRKG